MGIMQQKTKNNHTYIIAEAGQNHNGSLEKAKWLIDIAALKIGHGLQDNVFSADAIKFTKRDMSEELTLEECNRPYSGRHSYGETYGEHRAALELSYEEHAELFLYAKKMGLDFIETVCSPKCLRILDYFRPDFIKIASRDIDNWPLLEAVKKTNIPIILSTGMSDYAETLKAYTALSMQGVNEVNLLHCTSKYPSAYEDLSLNSIAFMDDKFKDVVVGYSDHTNGTLCAPLAVMAGAKIIEKHITYNKLAKGTDHCGSMDQEGFARVVRDIRNAELSKGKYGKEKPKGIKETEKKLRRVLVAGRDIKEGELIGGCAMLSGAGDFGGEWYHDIKDWVAVEPIKRGKAILQKHIDSAIITYNRGAYGLSK